MIKPARIALLAAVAALVPTTTALAGPPKEGGLEFDNCHQGKYEHHELGKALAIGTFEDGGGAYAKGDNKMMDGTSARCFGSYAVSDGKPAHQGYCWVFDAEGDKFVTSFRSTEGSKGVWEVVGGTGKYEGMTASGNYWRLGQPPALSANTYQFCNRNVGTYRLR